MTLPPDTAVRCDKPDERMSEMSSAGACDSSPTARPATRAAASGCTPSSARTRPLRTSVATVTNGSGRSTSMSDVALRLALTSRAQVAGATRPVTSIRAPAGGAIPPPKTVMGTSTAKFRSPASSVCARTRRLHRSVPPTDVLACGSPVTTARTVTIARASASEASGSA